MVMGVSAVEVGFATGAERSPGDGSSFAEGVPAVRSYPKNLDISRENPDRKAVFMRCPARGKHGKRPGFLLIRQAN
jgi:hypothetical protein